MPKNPFRENTALISHSTLSENLSDLDKRAAFIAELDEGHPIRQPALDSLDTLINAQNRPSELTEQLASAGLAFRNENDTEKGWIINAGNVLKHPIKTARYIKAAYEVIRFHAQWQSDFNHSLVTLDTMSFIVEDARRGRTSEEVQITAHEQVDRWAEHFTASIRSEELKQTLGQLALATHAYEA